VDAVPTQQYILLPLLYDSPQSLKDAVADDTGKKTNEELANEGERNYQEKEGGASNKENDENVQDFRSELDNLLVQQKEGYDNNTNRDSTDTGIFSGAYDDEDVGAEADLNNLETTMNVGPIPTTRIHKDHPKDQIIGDINSATQTRSMIKMSEEHAMVWTLVDLPKGKMAIGTKWVYRNKKDEIGIVLRNKARLVAHGYTQEEGINYDEVFAPVARIEAIRLFLAYASFMGFIMYQMDMKSAFLYGTIEEEVYVCQPPGFEDPQFPDKVYKVMQRDDGIFISQDKYVVDILKKFDFVTMKTASTPIKTNKALLKDEEAEDVDVHLYRSMIGSFMYLTASRPDIMFAVCTCVRDSPLDLEAFFDSDYAGASLDRKSTTGGCQFLGKRLISWQCKKQTIVANSTTEAEYVAAANCCGRVLWIQNQMLDYGFNFMNTKIYIDNESTICIVKNLIFSQRLLILTDLTSWLLALDYLISEDVFVRVMIDECVGRTRREEIDRDVCGGGAGLVGSDLMGGRGVGGVGMLRVGVNATDENRCIHHAYDRSLEISIAGISTPKGCKYSTYLVFISFKVGLHYLLAKVVSVGTAPGPNHDNYNDDNYNRRRWDAESEDPPRNNIPRIKFNNGEELVRELMR
ncbi:putative reverse transcriptase, RNA-dependent DNA polymerase, partial [Tanacetum coccineum]